MLVCSFAAQFSSTVLVSDRHASMADFWRRSPIWVGWMRWVVSARKPSLLAKIRSQILPRQLRSAITRYALGLCGSGFWVSSELLLLLASSGWGGIHAGRVYCRQDRRLLSPPCTRGR